MVPKWLDWGQRLQALAQNGLTFSTDPFDQQRYEAVRTIAAELIAAHTEAEVNELTHLFTDQKGYATPKVDARAAVFRDGKILMVRERLDGHWSLPGGWIDINESPSEAVVREVFEESGYQTRAIKLLALFDKNKHDHPPSIFHTYKLFFHCELLGGEPTLSTETDGVDFFPEAALPPLSSVRVTAGQIARLFELHRNPHGPTEFD